MTILNYVYSNLISLLIGIVSSYFVWYITYKVFVPKIKFSPKISKKKSPDSPSGFNYRFKFENSGFRDIIDINIYAKFIIYGLNGKSTKNKEVVFLETSFNGYQPILKPIKQFKDLFSDFDCTVKDENQHQNTKRSIIRVYPNNEKEFTRAYYPRKIISKAKKGKLTFEDIFGIEKYAELEIIIVGTDAFSNSKKVFNKTYFKTDIVQTSFEHDGLNIKNSNLKV